MVCRTDGPCLAPRVGFFLLTSPGIDRTSYLALFNCRLLSVGCMHLPHVQWIMLPSQYKGQSGHCISEDVPQCSKYSMLPMLVINSTFRWTDWTLQSCSNPALTSPCSGDSRTVESVFWRFPCDSSLLSGRLSEVYLEFCNQRYRQFSLHLTLCSLWWSVDFLASGLGESWRPCCEFGVSTTRGNLGN